MPEISTVTNFTEKSKIGQFHSKQAQFDKYIVPIINREVVDLDMT